MFTCCFSHVHLNSFLLSILSDRCEQQQQLDEPAVELKVGGGRGSHNLQTSVLSLLAGQTSRAAGIMHVWGGGEWASERVSE